MERWAEVRAAVERALELPEAERGAWLDAAVGSTGELRRAVDRLLAHADTDDEFLSPPTLAPGGASNAPDAAVGRRLGPFVLGPVLGQGGMGIVHRAEQERPRRQVAVKLIRNPLDSVRSRHRFEAEIDALARLQHPGIAQVFEAGIEPDGTCWFAMELLHGAEPLSRRERRPGDLRARLRLFTTIVDAIQHAHQRGVIHRDLKPANVLVLPDGQPKVIDFGIARVLSSDTSERTEAGQVLGTLAYMSPEQVEGRAIDVRTDVYGLGALLYELLTGQKPFDLDSLSLGAACRIIVQQDPPPPSSLATDCVRELDWIVARALAKEPAERYASAADLAADVRRLLADEPVLAAPPSRRYRLGKFVRRHRLAVLAGSLVVAVTIAALVTVSLALLRTQRAEAAERAGRTTAEASGKRATAALDFLLDVFSSVDPGKDGREVKMATALARAGRDVEQRFADQPGIRAALAHTIGTAYFGLGLLAEAEQHLQASASTYQTLPDRAHDHGETLLALALVQVRRGELDAAAATLQRAEQSIGAGGGDLAMVLATRQADLLRARGDKQGAKALLAPAVAAAAAAANPPKGLRMASMLLAGIHHELGELEVAEPLYQRAHDQAVALKGEDHPEALSTLNNLMMVQYARGRREAMLPTLQKLLTTRRRVLGDDHPDTIATLNNIAGVEMGLGRPAEAAVHFREAFDKILQREGEKHPATAAILGNLAAAERDAGDLPAAIEHADRAVALRRQHLGPAHESTLMSFTLAADLRRIHKDPAEALRQFEQCRALAAAATPPQIANLYRCDLGIGRCALDLERLDLAAAALQRCRDGHAAADKATPVRGQLAPPTVELEQLAKKQASQAK